MPAGERRRALLALLGSRGGASHRELSSALGVSETTVRRDLAALHQRGALRRVFGGAVPLDGGPAGPDAWPGARSDGIAAAAAALVRPGSTLAVSAGPHTAALAAALHGVRDLTVVTTSTAVAAALHGAPHREHIVVGGVSTAAGQVGPLAVATIRSLHVDTLFLAVHGVHPREGFTAAAAAEAETGRALVAAARRVVVLADHTAWQRTGAAVIARLDGADAVVTDRALPVEAQHVLAAHAGRLVLAGPHAAARVPRRHGRGGTSQPSA
ncbi:DeoR/GlpR family DNA-binding transcription regulator [Actinacidiphila sp. DG2A-62]|uniref:DeoR/GlpR family DNA-binding transcription regulator n=1 Tax=Actinacidiphila sp. DG2A-62 TaxID=3108821 RepID=UPI002DB87858|nr:DeoR/GlpR family DNA-binding transcription regulator [Actinacidiphila sp. DG2A-62]MEC3992174.1 DeoR/GlpR family DNA-binding transcription regulator [Actinacidiphila sp. DG2A-62]